MAGYTFTTKIDVAADGTVQILDMKMVSDDLILDPRIVHPDNITKPPDPAHSPESGLPTGKEF